jgi:hypothetical protein
MPRKIKQTSSKRSARSPIKAAASSAPKKPARSTKPRVTGKKSSVAPAIKSQPLTRAAAQKSRQRG